MKLLLIKSSSLGDIIHSFPAVTEATDNINDLSIDWLVEESFAELPLWHNGIENIITVATRRWRKNILQAYSNNEISSFLSNLKAKKYDAIIDAQGLIKSAVFSKIAQGSSHGYSYSSAREPLASIFYNNTHKISWDMHAVDRIRTLFAKSLGYDIPEKTTSCGLDRTSFSNQVNSNNKPYIIFFHGTTWKFKHWPDHNWCNLAKLLEQYDINVYLPSYNKIERTRAEKIAKYSNKVKLLDKMSINDLAAILAKATASVAVDTGFAHLSGALGIPCVSLYNVTNPKNIGAYGNNQIHLYSENFIKNQVFSNQLEKFDSITPTEVVANLQKLVAL
jgi:heptosyltransferase-1